MCSSLLPLISLTKMKPFLLCFIFFVVFWSSSTLVRSEDSCSQNVESQAIMFDTSSLRCSVVWKDHNFILRVSPNLWSFVLSFSMNINTYGAIGFSSNGQMVGSSAIVGWATSSDPGRIEQYYLGGTTQEQVIAGKGDLPWTKASTVSTSTSIVYVAFQLQTSQPSPYLIFALGPPNSFPSGANSRLPIHNDMISINIDYASGTASVTSTLKLKRMHGWLNIGGWSLLMMMGAIIARHCKQWDPLWFYLHFSLQTLGYVAGVVGIIFGLALSKKVSSNVVAHKNIGILILVLGCLQVLALVLRPRKESNLLRKYWNYYHHNIGRILLIFALVNGFYGLHLGGEGTKWFAGYGAGVAFLVIVAVILEIRMWMKPKTQMPK